ncbi:MAG: FAD:protein FMN transferase [Fusobacteriaceae bacterium]
MKNNREYKAVTIFFVLLFLFSACSGKKIKRYEEERFLFSTYIKIILYENSQVKAKEYMELAFKEIERIDKKFNNKQPESIITKLNNSKDRKTILDNEGIYLFNKINEVYKLSGKKYDITIYPLLHAWGFLEDKNEKIPTAEEIREAQKYIGYEKVEIKGNELILQEPIKELDTGSFLKGYAIEKGKEKLLEKGVKSAFITSISSVVTIGTKPDGSSWKIGIQNPEKLEEILGVVELNNEAMGVSGDYQTFVEIQGKKYHHIIEKATGYPINDKKMVVVVGKDAFEADLLSTAFFLMETEDVIEYSEKNKDLKTFIVTDEMKIIKDSKIKLKVK